MSPGARLSETRAVVRSDWDPSSPIVTLQAEAGTTYYVFVDGYSDAEANRGGFALTLSAGACGSCGAPSAPS